MAPAPWDEPDLDRPPRWTATLVLLRLEEAVSTLARLPQAEWRPRLVSWPRTRAGEGAAPRRQGRPAPQPAAIDRLDDTLSWLGWLEPASARILWARASGCTWRRVATLSGRGMRTCQRRAGEALIAIAERLNAERR